MKLLRDTPPIPPYLHMGSVWLIVSTGPERSKELHRLIGDKWRQISADVVQDRQNVREITRRIDERSADPDYHEATYEVFYTISEDEKGRTFVNYYF